MKMLYLTIQLFKFMMLNAFLINHFCPFFLLNKFNIAIYIMKKKKRTTIMKLYNNSYPSEYQTLTIQYNICFEYNKFITRLLYLF